MTSFWHRFLVPLDLDLLAILGGGEAFSTAELAAHLHVTERAIQHAKKRLVDRSLLRVVDRGGGRGRPARYEAVEG